MDVIQDVMKTYIGALGAWTTATATTFILDGETAKLRPV